MQHGIAQHARIGIRYRGPLEDGRIVVRQRRHANLLARLKPLARFSALAVHAQLAGAQQLLQPPVTDLRKAAMEPAVEAQFGASSSDTATV